MSYSMARCGDVVRTIETPLDLKGNLNYARINSDFYYKDGCILPYKKHDSKFVQTVVRARNKFNLLLHGNFLDKSPVYFVTLTSRDVISDEHFIKHTKDFLGGYYDGARNQLLYLGVFEEQKRGVLHAHFLAYSDRWCVPDFVKQWKLGFGYCQQVREGVTDLGLYLSAYLCKDKHGDIRTIRTIGKNSQLYFRSRNLKNVTRCGMDDYCDLLDAQEISARKRFQSIGDSITIPIEEKYYKINKGVNE